MNIKYYCPIWGMKHLPLEYALEKIKSSGYDGAEIGLDPDIQDIYQVKQLFKNYDLELLAQLSSAKGSTPGKLYTDYISKLDKILEIAPVKVNCHTGRDFYTVEENKKFIREAEILSQKHDIAVIHETHRGRFSFCTALIGKYIDAFPDLKLTADFSHWCVVSESLLEDQQEILNKVIPHCSHIHARVGYAQGPQVPHPNAGEYREELQQHLQWWKKIVQHHQHIDEKEFTITCEFGPLPYMHTLPFTNQPVASQYEVNLFMKNYLTQNL